MSSKKVIRVTMIKEAKLIKLISKRESNIDFPNTDIMILKSFQKELLEIEALFHSARTQKVQGITNGLDNKS